eukprot:gene1724-3340_t
MSQSLPKGKNFQGCSDATKIIISCSLFSQGKKSYLNKLSAYTAIIMIITTGLTLGICLGMSQNLGSSVNNSVKSNLYSQIKKNIEVNILEISSSLERSLLGLAASTTMVDSLYLYSLISNHSMSTPLNNIYSSSSILKSQQSFRSYQFIPGCKYPSCPSDFPQRNNDFPISTLSSAVYLYDTQFPLVDNNSTWNDLMDSNSNIKQIIDTSAYIYFDSVRDLHNNIKDYESIIFKSITVKLETKMKMTKDAGRSVSSSSTSSSTSPNYTVIHRIYPGYFINSTVPYDPCKENWFIRSPVNGVYLDDPIYDPVIGQLFVTLSSKKILTLPYQDNDNNNINDSKYEQLVTVVSSIRIPLSILGDTIQSLLTLTTNGADNVNGNGYVNDNDDDDDGDGTGSFFAVVNYDTLEVLLDTKSFKKINQVEPAFDNIDIRTSTSTRFSYVDNEGVVWMVTSVPFFPSHSTSTSTTYSNGTYSTSTLSSHRRKDESGVVASTFQSLVSQIELTLLGKERRLKPSATAINSTAAAVMTTCHNHHCYDKNPFYVEDKYLSSQSVSWIVFTRMKLYTLIFLVLLGLLTMTLLTIVFLWSDGTGVWKNDMDSSYEDQNMNRLRAVTAIRAEDIRTVYYQRTTEELLSASSYITALLEGNLSTVTATSINTNTNNSNSSNNLFQSQQLEQKQGYLESYSLDKTNFFTSKKIAYTSEYSGYFISDSANCITKSNCSVYQNSSDVKITSLIDLKLRSYFHNASSIDFIQIGLAGSGLVRNIPFAYTSYGEGRQCFVEDITDELCKDMYETSSCASSSPSLFQNHFPPYDPSNGHIVVTATIPLRSVTAATGGNNKLLGVLSSNTEVQALSNMLNRNNNNVNDNVHTNSYYYIIDSTSTSTVIIHPNLSSSSLPLSSIAYDDGSSSSRDRGTLFQIESQFSVDEFKIFQKNILDVIQINTLEDMNMSLPSKYIKNGKQWRIAYAPVIYGTVKYTLIGTELLTAGDLKSNINDSDSNNCSDFDCIYNSLRDILKILRIKGNNYKTFNHNNNKDNNNKNYYYYNNNNNISDNNTNSNNCNNSSNNICLREDLEVAYHMYSDALQVYTDHENNKGIGVCQMNLGHIALSSGEYTDAEGFYKNAISISQNELINIRNSNDCHNSHNHSNKHNVDNSNENTKGILFASECNLSDRMGHLAELYIEINDIPKALEILDTILLEDIGSGYMSGYVRKQGLMSRIHLARGEVLEAERILLRSHDMILHKDYCNANNNSNINNHSNSNSNCTEEDLAVLEQLAMYNIAKLRHSQNFSLAAEQAFLDVLTTQPVMDRYIIEKTLFALKNMYTTQGRHSDGIELEGIASNHGFHLNPSRGKAVCAKNVVVVIDFSDGNNKDGNNNNNKNNINDSDTFNIEDIYQDRDRSSRKHRIHAIQKCIASVFHNDIYPHDSFMLLHSSSRSGVQVDVPLREKIDHENLIEKEINALHQHEFAHSFIHSVTYGIHTLSHSDPKKHWWVICITDGETNISEAADNCDDNGNGGCDYIPDTNTGIITICVNDGPYWERIEEVTLQSRAGSFIPCSNNENSISEAFSKAVKILHGDVMYMKDKIIFEDF